MVMVLIKKWKEINSVYIIDLRLIHSFFSHKKIISKVKTINLPFIELLISLLKFVIFERKVFYEKQI